MGASGYRIHRIWSAQGWCEIGPNDLAAQITRQLCVTPWHILAANEMAAAETRGGAFEVWSGAAERHEALASFTTLEAACVAIELLA